MSNKQLFRVEVCFRECVRTSTEVEHDLQGSFYTHTVSTTETVFFQPSRTVVVAKTLVHLLLLAEVPFTLAVMIYNPKNGAEELHVSYNSLFKPSNRSSLKEVLYWINS